MKPENSIRRSVSIVLGMHVHHYRRSLTMLLSMLVLASLAASHGSAQEIRVGIYTYKQIAAEKALPLGNVTVKIGTSTVTTDAAGKASIIVPKGYHNVKAYLQGFIVTSLNFTPNAVGGMHGVAAAKSDEGDLDLPFLYRSHYEEVKEDSTLGIYMKPGEQQQKDKFEALKFLVSLRMPDCENPNYEGAEIMIDQTKVTGFLSLGSCVSCTVDLKPGPHEITTDYLTTEIKRVEVSRNSYSYGKFFPSDRRRVKVILDERIWEHSSPGDLLLLEIELPLNCDDPDFSVAKILAISGKAEIIAPESSGAKQVRVNERIERNSTLRTDPGSSIILESKHGHLITVGESTEVQTNLIMTKNGREKLEAFIKMGKIQIKRVSPERSSESMESTGMNARTTAVKITDKETIYMVSHDEKTNVTTVGVEEGKVEVAPVNSSLKPFTLEANQQVAVSDKSVSAISHYSGERTRAVGILLYVGIGAAALIGLLVVVAGITFLYRRVHRPPVQPAFQQSRIHVAATPANFASAAATKVATNVATNEWRCPNPTCGKLVPAGKKFCTACGSAQSAVKVDATPANITSPAVASSERLCPNPQCRKSVPAAKKFCTACGARLV